MVKAAAVMLERGRIQVRKKAEQPKEFLASVELLAAAPHERAYCRGSYREVAPLLPITLAATPVACLHRGARLIAARQRPTTSMTSMVTIPGMVTMLGMPKGSFGRSGLTLTFLMLYVGFSAGSPRTFLQSKDKSVFPLKEVAFVLLIGAMRMVQSKKKAGMLSVVGGNGSRRGILRLVSMGRGPVVADFSRHNPSRTSASGHPLGTNDMAAGDSLGGRQTENRGTHGLARDVEDDDASFVGDLPRRHSTSGFCAEREVNVASDGKGSGVTSHGTGSIGEKEKKVNGGAGVLIAPLEEITPEGAYYGWDRRAGGPSLPTSLAAIQVTRP